MEKMVDQPTINQRPWDDNHKNTLESAGIHPLLARLWAARGVSAPEQTATAWRHMLAPHQLKSVHDAAALLADAIAADKLLLIIADYDCDGATACAVGIRALRAMGARVDFMVPDRFETGYGLSPELVEQIVARAGPRPDILITVDNGIASVDGVAAASRHGMEVIITDHHLPGDTLPNALAIVNPNQPGCEFPSKNMAGVGVMFYLMLALRAEQRQRGLFSDKNEPRLDQLADLVALGTVADVVTLDHNNRLLVAQGLNRMRAGQMQPGIRALFAVAGRNPIEASTFDLGFALGPRINAAGRLADMGVGVACLITDDSGKALELARELDQINQQRRQIETTMREEALETMEAAKRRVGATVTLFHPDWHQGVVGLVASRIKDRYWRATMAFAPDTDGQLRGSGRSIPDVHLRDVLDLVAKRHPGIILKFGGHAMAAGLTLRQDAYEVFQHAFDDAVQELTGRNHFEPLIETDGSLESGYANVQVASLLQQQIWGAGFPAPIFHDTFRVRNQRLLKGRHLKLFLERGHQHFDAIWFNHNTLLGEHIEAAYRLDLNTWQGRQQAQLVIEHARDA